MNLNIEAVLPNDMKIPVLHAFIGEIELSRGDDIKIFEVEDPEAIGKIHEILWDCMKGDVKILVQWYYKPADTQNEQILATCSEIEVFLSDSFMEIELGTVDGKVKILDLEALMDLDEVEEDIYMCRAQWKHRECELEPPINLWRKGCVCNSIINPDMPFKICTDCNAFFHVKCLESQSSSACNKCGKEL